MTLAPGIELGLPRDDSRERADMVYCTCRDLRTILSARAGPDTMTNRVSANNTFHQHLPLSFPKRGTVEMPCLSAQRLPC